MALFEKIKNFYNKKLYTKEMLKQFVVKGVITPEQYKEITGEDYTE